jgi:hypothetical protein
MHQLHPTTEKRIITIALVVAFVSFAASIAFGGDRENTGGTTAASAKAAARAAQNAQDSRVPYSSPGLIEDGSPGKITEMIRFGRNFTLTYTFERDPVTHQAFGPSGSINNTGRLSGPV